MANTLSKISLGFAEFVSQLLQETFDAVLNTQNYQYDKYEEIQTALNFTTSRFKEFYISDEEVLEYLNTILNFDPSNSILLKQGEIEKTKSIMQADEFEKAVKNNKLTDFGVTYLVDFYTDKLVQIKKSKLRTILNNQQNTTMRISNGEIKAKVELFCLSDYVQKENLATDKARESPVAPMAKRESFDISKISRLETESNLIKEVFDEKTKLRTLLIDKSKIVERIGSIKSIPGTRIVANPVSSTTSTNLYSEITINFTL